MISTRTAVFAVIVACGALPGCGPNAPSHEHAAASPHPPTPIPATPPPVNFHGHRVGSRYVYATKQKGLRKVYVLRADTVSAIYNGATTGRSDFTNPHVTFFGDGGKALVADAPAGTVVEKDKTVVMTGGVHARTEDGMTLASDTMRYDDEMQIVHGNGHVTVMFPGGEELQGETVDWNLRDGHINVGGAP